MTAPASAPLTSVRCVRCGYPLAAPSRDEACPECGAPAALAIDGPFDVRASRHVRAGAWVLLGAAILRTAMELEGVVHFFAPWPLPQLTAQLPPEVIGVLIDACAVLIGVAAVLLTTPSRQAFGRAPSRRLARGVAIASLAITLGRSTGRLVTPALLQSFWSAPDRPFRLATTAALLVLLVVVSTPLARRVGARGVWWTPGLIAAGTLAVWCLPIVASQSLELHAVLSTIFDVILACLLVPITVWIARLARWSGRPGPRRLARVTVIAASIDALRAAIDSVLLPAEFLFDWSVPLALVNTMQLLALIFIPLRWFTILAVPRLVLQLVRPPAPTVTRG